MSHYTIDELIARWKREELTIEQVIGQILLLLKEQDRRLREAALQTHARREQWALRHQHADASRRCNPKQETRYWTRTNADERG